MKQNSMFVFLFLSALWVVGVVRGMEQKVTAQTAAQNIVHLPDGTRATFDLQAQDPLTLDTIDDLRKAQVEQGEPYFIVRAVEIEQSKVFNDEGKVIDTQRKIMSPRYFDAHQFNWQFFDYEEYDLNRNSWDGTGEGYPIDFQWSKASQNTLRRLAEQRGLETGDIRKQEKKEIAENLQYFIYESNEAQRGFQYFCTYDSKEQKFYNDTKGSRWQGRSQDFFLKTLYANRPFDRNTQLKDMSDKEKKEWKEKYTSKFWLANNFFKGTDGLPLDWDQAEILLKQILEEPKNDQLMPRVKKDAKPLYDQIMSARAQEAVPQLMLLHSHLLALSAR